MNKKITRLGIDLAKNIFQVCAVNERGHVLFNKKLKRDQLPTCMAHTPDCEVILEACGSSSYWAQVFTGDGHNVKLINPADVRSFVKINNNDAADAGALCEAAARPTMRFVQPKTADQQDIQLLHQVRSQLVSKRTRLTNQIRGLLVEYGLIIPVGIRHVRQQLPALVEDAENALSSIAREVFIALYEE